MAGKAKTTIRGKAPKKSSSKKTTVKEQGKAVRAMLKKARTKK